MILLILISSLGTAAPHQIAASHTVEKKLQPDTSLILLDDDSDAAITILSPLSSIPAIVAHGDNVTITFESRNFDHLYVCIATAFEPVVDTIWLPVETLEKSDTTWSATASISGNISEELYNLTLVVENNGIFTHSTMPRSVKVIESFSDTFSFVHITDLHVGDPRGFRESIRETIDYKSIKKCIDEINLLHPDFVIISGDLVFGQLYPFEYRR